MDVDPLIRELGLDETSGSEALVEQAAKIFVAFSGGFLTDDKEEFSRAIVDTGRKLLAARPNLGPLFHMVTELFALANEPVDLVMAKRAIRSAAVDFTQTWSARAAKVAGQGAEQFGTAARALTVGRSDVVERALLTAAGSGTLAGCVVGEGRPAWTGRPLAEALVNAGALNVRLVPDLGLFGCLEDVDLVLIGTGAVRAEGAVTPSGTGALVAAAKAAGKPAYLLSGVMTLLPGQAKLPEAVTMVRPDSVWDKPPEGVTVENFPDEVTPVTRFKGVVMENGLNEPPDIVQRVHTMPVPPWV
jgi:translation initiation factor 2B subunit (eIF-2B alpha/beta/delta family)